MRRAGLLLLTLSTASCNGCRKSPPAPIAASHVPTPVGYAATAASADAAPGDAASLAAAPDAALCKAMQEVTRAAWKAKPACGAPSGWDACVSAAAGSWGIEVGAIDDNGNQPTTTCDFEWKLVHIDRKGTRATKTYSAQVRAGIKNAPRRMLHVTGDGVFLELRSEGVYGEQPEETREVLVVRDGKIVPYPGLVGRAAVDVHDADDDGRTDFVLKSPFMVRRAQGQPTGLHAHDEEGPRPMAHALADGALSFDDDVARSLVRAQCSARPAARPPRHPDAGSDWFPEAGEWIACSRYWGVRSELLTAALDERCASYVDVIALDTGADLLPDDEGTPGARCPTFFRAWAETKAPFLLK